MALPFPMRSFDAAVMALVIILLADPARSVAEMARVVRPGGTVSAYVWATLENGAPYVPIQLALAAHDHTSPAPLSPAASSIEGLQALWTAAGLVDVHAHGILAQMRFDSFDSYWNMMRRMPRVSAVFDRIGEAETAAVRDDLRRSVAAGTDGPFTATAHANAVRGRVPAP